MSTLVSIVGTVATPPRRVGPGGKTPFCTFRVASNERRYDREKNQWVDGETNWFTINAFRSLAENAVGSLRKGDRVVVNGRLRIKSWNTDEKSGISVEIDADALGHDLRWGVTRFEKQGRTEAATLAPAGAASGAPAMSIGTGSPGDGHPAEDRSAEGRPGGVGAGDGRDSRNDSAEPLGDDGFTPLVSVAA